MSEWGNRFVALKWTAEEEDYPAANLVWGSVFFPCCAENNFWIILCKCGPSRMTSVDDNVKVINPTFPTTANGRSLAVHKLEIMQSL